MAEINLGYDPLTSGGISLDSTFPLQEQYAPQSSGTSEIVIEASSVHDALKRIQGLKDRASALPFGQFNDMSCYAWHGPGASAMDSLASTTKSLRDATLTMLDNTTDALQSAVEHFEETDRRLAQGM